MPAPAKRHSRGAAVEASALAIVRWGLNRLPLPVENGALKRDRCRTCRGEGSCPICAWTDAAIKLDRAASDPQALIPEVEEP